MPRVGLLVGSLVGILILLASAVGPPLLVKSSESTADLACTPQTFYLGDQLIDIASINISVQDKEKALELINFINKEQNALVLLTLNRNGVPQVNLILLPGLTSDEYEHVLDIAYQISTIIHGTVNIIDLRTFEITPIDNESKYFNIIDKLFNYVKETNSDILGLTMTINSKKGILILTVATSKDIIANNSKVNNIMLDIEKAYINLINDCNRPLLIISVEELIPYVEIENNNSTINLEPVETLPSPTPPAPQEIEPPLILPVALALAAGLLIALFRIV